jgi:hypothetical protein
MKNALRAFAFLLASAAAFAIGDVTAARSAANDISSALGQDPKTGLPYLRVFVVNAATARTGDAALSADGAPTAHTALLADGESFPINGTLTSAAAVDRPCDLIIFENGQSRIILTSPSGTALKDLAVNGTVSASGNPLGYTCSVELKYTTP